MRLGDEATGPIHDVLAERASKAGRLEHALRGPLRAEAAGLVRLMTCCYSNPIEGHVTRPRDIAKAIGDEPSEDSSQGLCAKPIAE